MPQPTILDPVTDDGWPVERIATKVASIWGQDAAWVWDGDPGAHEAGHLKLDSSKARAELGWRPRLRMEAAVEWTVDWYRAWHRGEPLRERTLAQIASHEDLDPVSIS